MGVIGYADHEGRCPVFDGRGGTREILANYSECPDGPPGGAMETIRHDERVYVQDDVGVLHEATGADVGSMIAGQQLVALKEQEKARLKAQGMSDAAADAEAWARTYQVNHDLVRQYLRLPLGVEDQLRRAGTAAGYSLQDGAGFTYHVSGYQKPADQPPSAEEARKGLLALARQKMKVGPAEALLDLIATEQGRQLLDIILAGEGEE